MISVEVLIVRREKSQQQVNLHFFKTICWLNFLLTSSIILTDMKYVKTNMKFTDNMQIQEYFFFFYGNMMIKCLIEWWMLSHLRILSRYDSCKLRIFVRLAFLGIMVMIFKVNNNTCTCHAFNNWTSLLLLNWFLSIEIHYWKS